MNDRHLLPPAGNAGSRDRAAQSSRPSPRARLRQRLKAKWQQAQSQYAEAGTPFGNTPRAVEVWIEYGRQTRAN